METTTLDADTRDLLALVAGGLAGGRHAYRVKDADVKASAQALTRSARSAVKRSQARSRYAHAREVEAREALFNGYAAWHVCELSEHTTDCCALGELTDAWKRTPKRSVIRQVARALLADTATCRNCDIDGTCPAHTIPTEWRALVRAYRDGRHLSAGYYSHVDGVQVFTPGIGSFLPSRDDMRADNRSRFYRNVQFHWHAWAGGKHAAIHGVTADDVVQDAYLSALESREGLTFGGMYGHARMATERAVYAYRRIGNGHSDNIREWTWADWEEWAKANDGSDRLAYSTLPEWQVFDAARAARTAQVKHAESITVYREALATRLSDSRSAMARLILGGMTVKRMANLLGRTPDGILKDLSDSHELPVSFAL